MTRVIDTSQISTADSAVYYANEEPVKQGEDKEIRLLASPEKLRAINVGMWADAEESGKVKDVLEILKGFVVGPTGHYLPESDALDVLRDSSMGQLNDALAKLREISMEVAAPNE